MGNYQAMIKGKQRQLRTRAFGAEPDIPDIPSLADWIAGRRGMQGDLTSFQLEQSLAPQQEAGITMSCAGGKFYRGRLMGCLLGLDESAVIAEIDVDPDPVIADAAETASAVRDATIAMPAPHVLGIADRYYHDEDEWAGAITGAYRSLMRSMRDAGCGGHVLICDRIDEAEVSALAGKRVFFFHPSPVKEDLEILLERQPVVAVRKQDLTMAMDLSDEYDLSGLVIVDPDDTAIHAARERFDEEKIAAGGYCTCGCTTYWKDLAVSAIYRH